MQDGHFLSPKPRKEISEFEFVTAEGGPVTGTFDAARFRLVAAKKIHFHGVSFKYCIFDDCYFRDCRFEDCDFTGSTFRNSILRGSSFDGSRFDYCRFTHSVVPRSILERHMPGYENVALELARALRVNYAQVGDSEAVNKAISAELNATRIHLKKAAWSPEGYYRDKYRGLERVARIFEYYWFLLLDFVWGHGESLPKLLRTIIFVFAVLVVWLMVSQCSGFSQSVRAAFLIAWGGYENAGQLPLVIAITVAVRTVLLGLFIAVVIRRLSRR